MKIVVGAVTVIFSLLYVGQLISVVNLGIAQKWGLQEDPAGVDSLTTYLEVWTARWDLAWLWTLPGAGVLILISHPWWPFLALIGGGAYVDAGGREAAKLRGLAEQGIRTGTPGERRAQTIAYVTFIAVGCLAIALALSELS